jgi:hypothetical protein
VQLDIAHWPADSSDAIRETTVGGVLREAAAAAPDALALIEGIAQRAQRRRWTFAQLLDEDARS